MSEKKIVKAIPITTLTSASVTPAVFAAINPDGLPHSCFMLRITNDYNSPPLGHVRFGEDNSGNAFSHDFILEESSIQIYSPRNDGEKVGFKKGMIVWIKVLKSTGTFYLSGYYISGG